MIICSLQGKWVFWKITIGLKKSWQKRGNIVWNLEKPKSAFEEEGLLGKLEEILDKKKGGTTMSITATELKLNLSKYLLLAEKEDICITKNGRPIAKLVSPYQDKLKLVDELFSSLPSDLNLEEAREERMKQL